MQHKIGLDKEKCGVEHCFREAFNMHYEGLHRYAYTLLKNRDEANDIVQNVFVALWEKKDLLIIEKSLQAYLYTSVNRRCLNQIQHRKIKNRHAATTYQNENEYTEETMDQVLVKEMQFKIHNALKDLPSQCRRIFLKSRYEEKRYAEIAAELNLSVKTVEAQMGKALKLLRQKIFAP